MELHAVHFNTKFGSNLAEALATSGKAYNTLAVLAVMFTVQEEDNPMLQPIVDGITLIIPVFKYIFWSAPLDLLNFFPSLE